MTATNWTADPAAMLRKTIEHDAFAAEIQLRRDWHLPAGADVIDLTERFAPRCEPEPPKLDREPESEFERQIAALLAEKPSQAREFAFWGLILGTWMFAILSICVLIAR